VAIPDNVNCGAAKVAVTVEELTAANTSEAVANGGRVIVHDDKYVLSESVIVILLVNKELAGPSSVNEMNASTPGLGPFKSMVGGLFTAFTEIVAVLGALCEVTELLSSLQ